MPSRWARRRSTARIGSSPICGSPTAKTASRGGRSRRSKRPAIRWCGSRSPTPLQLGQEFFRWEMATAVAGSIIGINPFDQPDVEASKVKTRELTAAYEETGALPAEQPFFGGGGFELYADRRNEAALKPHATSLAAALKAHFGRIGAGDYVALLAYIERSPAHIATLQRLRRQDPRPDQGGDLPRLWSALSAFDRSGLQGRPEQRGVFADHLRGCGRSAGAGSEIQLWRGQGGAGARRFRRAGRTRAARAAGPHLGRSRRRPRGARPAPSSEALCIIASSAPQALGGSEDRERDSASVSACGTRNDRSRPDGRQHRPPADASTGTAASSTTRAPRRCAGSPAKGRAASRDLGDFVRQLSPPRAVWVMLPAGEITDGTIVELAGLLASRRHRHRRRQFVLIRTTSATPTCCGRRASRFVDVGTSGGVWGLERGYCMMIGGDKAVVDHLDPIFKTLAPGIGNIDRTPGREGRDPRAEEGYLHCGPAGAGHFVKMVHNGIEYGVMQAYAEGFDILRNVNSAAVPGKPPLPARPARHRRGVAARQRDLVLAPRSDRDRARRRSRACRTSPGRSRIRAKGGGRSRRRSRRRCRPRCCRGALYTRFRSRQRPHLCRAHPVGDAPRVRRPPGTGNDGEGLNHECRIDKRQARAARPRRRPARW